MGIMDTKPTKGASGEKLPKGVNASDATGERKMPLKGGVAMGKMDSLGNRPASHAGNFEGHMGELNDGNKGERNVYDHKRIEHEQD